jgi:hypothetical protein
MKNYQYITIFLLLIASCRLQAESLLRIVKSGDMTKLKTILERGYKVTLLGSREEIDFNKVYDNSYDLLSYCIKHKPKNADLMIRALIDYAKKEKQYNPHYNHIIYSLQQDQVEQAKEILELLMISEFPGVKRNHKDQYILRILTAMEKDHKEILTRGEIGKRFVDKILDYVDEDHTIYQMVKKIVGENLEDPIPSCHEEPSPLAILSPMATDTLHLLKPQERSCSLKLQQYWKDKKNKDFFKMAGIQLGHLNYEALNFCETLIDENLIVVQQPHYLKKGVKYYYSAETNPTELCRYYGFWSAVPEHMMQESWEHIVSYPSKQLAYLQSSKKQPYLLDVVQERGEVATIKNLYCHLYPSEKERQDVLLNQRKIKKD